MNCIKTIKKPNVNGGLSENGENMCVEFGINESISRKNAVVYKSIACLAL